jgi:hypothetical protein
MKNYFTTLVAYKQNIPIGSKITRTKAKNAKIAEENIREWVRCFNTYSTEKYSYVFEGKCFTLEEIELV